MSVLAACPSPPPYPAPAADRPHYALTIRWTPAHDVVDGRVAIAFTPNRSTSRLYLRLWPNGPYTWSRGARLSVAGARVDSKRVRVALPNRTTLVLQRGARAGERVNISLAWRLMLPRRPAGRLSGRGETLRLGSFFPILPWDPDHGGWALDPATTSIAEAWTSPTADFDVRISAPRRDTILASGDRVGPRTWHGTAIRDFALAAGDFRTTTALVHAPDPVRVTVGVERRVRSPSPQAFRRRAERALVELSRRYGRYPWRSFSLAVSKDIGASGIEYPTLIFQGARSLYIATTHETAHQWFYSLVGNDQARDPWLDEALATWAAGEIDGTRGYFAGFRVSPAGRGHLGSSMHYWERHMSSYFAGVYAQGVRALLSLGPPAKVDCALRLYVAQRAYSIARPHDLVAALDEVLPGAAAKLRAYGIR
jgi:hypothetical protein